MTFTHSSTRNDYEDVAIIDGESFSIGREPRNIAVLRIRPGVRDVILESRRRDHTLKSEQQANAYGQCLPPDCAAFLPSNEQQMTLAEDSQVICSRKLKIKFEADASSWATLDVRSDGCLLSSPAMRDD